MKYIENIIKDFMKPVKSCSKFNPLKIANYFENCLTPQEKAVFEKHLFNCGFCFTKYMQLGNDIAIFKNISRKIPEIKKLVSDIVIKTFNQGMNILKYFNLVQSKIVYAPSMRNKSHKKFIKRIVFSSDNVKIEIIHCGKEQILLKLKPLKSLLYRTASLFYNDKLFRAKSFSENNEIIFEDLKPGNYKIKLLDKTIKLKIT